MIRGKRLMIDDYLYEWKSPEIPYTAYGIRVMTKTLPIR